MSNTPYSIHLWADDLYEHYCGCWHVPCPDDDPIIPRLDAANVGRYRDEDGTVRRAFFFADEITPALVDHVRRATECYVEVTPLREQVSA